MEPHTKRQRYAQMILYIFGRKKKLPPPSGMPRSIIILGLERFGDSILTTPLLRTLRKALPDLELYVITPGNRSYSFYQYDTNITRLFHAKKELLSCFWFFLFHPADILFNPKDNLSFTFVLLSRILRSRHSVGIAFPFHDDHYNAVVQVASSEHIIKKNMALLNHLSIEYSEQDLLPFIPPMPLNESITTFAQTLQGQSIIAINISAGSVVRERSKELWLEVIKHLGCRCVIFAMPQRYEDKRWLEHYDEVIASPNTSSFSESEYLLQQCIALISPDTAMIHLASAVQLPTVGLFLTQHDADRFAPFGVPHKIIFGKQSLDDIDALSIVDAVKDILSNGSNAAK